MLVKLEKLFNMQQSLNRITTIPLETKTGYRLGKILKKIISELKDLEEERKKLVEKFGEKDDKGNTKVSDNNLAKFNEQWQALLEEEIELDIIKVPFEMLKDAKLSAREFMDLEDIIEEPKDADIAG